MQAMYGEDTFIPIVVKNNDQPNTFRLGKLQGWVSTVKEEIIIAPNEEAIIVIVVHPDDKMHQLTAVPSGVGIVAQRF